MRFGKVCCLKKKSFMRINYMFLLPLLSASESHEKVFSIISFSFLSLDKFMLWCPTRYIQLNLSYKLFFKYFQLFKLFKKLYFLCVFYFILDLKDFMLQFWAVNFLRASLFDLHGKTWNFDGNLQLLLVFFVKANFLRWEGYRAI